MGGHSADKLASVRDEIGAPANTPLVVTDAADAASLKATLQSATQHPEELALASRARRSPSRWPRTVRWNRDDRDPGYGSTPKMIAEAAVRLLRDATGAAGGRI